MTSVRKSELETYWDNIDGPAVKQVTTVVVGCGNRGQNYAAFAQDFPSRLKVVGVAEPVVHRRRRMQTAYSIEEDKCVEDWRILTGRGVKLADAVIICTQDMDHKVPLMNICCTNLEAFASDLKDSIVHSSVRPSFHPTSHQLIWSVNQL